MRPRWSLERERSPNGISRLTESGGGRTRESGGRDQQNRSDPFESSLNH